MIGRPVGSVSVVTRRGIARERAAPYCATASGQSRENNEGERLRGSRVLYKSFNCIASGDASGVELDGTCVVSDEMNMAAADAESVSADRGGPQVQPAPCSSREKYVDWALDARTVTAGRLTLPRRSGFTVWSSGSNVGCYCLHA